MTFSITGTILSLIVQALEVGGVLGLLFLFALMAIESFGIPPLPSEVILPVAGFIIATGGDAFFTWPTVMFAAIAGALLGSLVGYEVGKRFGLPFVERVGRRVGLEVKDLDRAQEFFERRGPVTVSVSRLIPVLRAYISYPAGAARMRRDHFAVFTVLGAIPFTFVMVYLGYVLGQNYGEVGRYYGDLDYLAVAVLALLVLLLLYRLHRRSRAASPSPRTAEPEGTDAPPSP
jgi:membrane protein DedA with SNARE-associated domain